jgi:hypothetical protein
MPKITSKRFDDGRQPLIIRPVIFPHETAEGMPYVIVDRLTGEVDCLLLPEIPGDAPALIQEGIARRCVTATEGVCPCGAVLGHLSKEQGLSCVARGTCPVAHTYDHATDCPASDTILEPALRAWHMWHA